MSLWCVENVVAMTQLSNYSVTYEDLLPSIYERGQYCTSKVTQLQSDISAF